MVQKRGFDAPVGPSPAADPAAVRLLYAYVASATVWLLVGTAGGLIASIKLNSPDALAVPWLSFGRLRAIHTNVVFWGWSTIASSGMALYVGWPPPGAPPCHPVRPAPPRGLGTGWRLGPGIPSAADITA